MPPKRSKQYSRASKARRPSAIQGALDLDLQSDDIVDSPEVSRGTQSNNRGKMQDNKSNPNLESSMAAMWSDPPVYDAPFPVEAIPDTFQDAFQDDLEDFDLQMKSSSPHTILERSLAPGTAATSAQSQRTVAVMGDDFLSDDDSPPAVELTQAVESTQATKSTQAAKPTQTVKPTQAVKPSQVPSEVDASRPSTAKPIKAKKARQVAKMPFDEASASQAPVPVKKPAPKPAKPSGRSKQPPKKPPPKKLKRHELMQTYDGKTPSPAIEQEKRASRGSTARQKQKQPPRVVIDKKPAPVPEMSNDKLINEHSLRKPQIISFSPDGPRNMGRRSPEKHQLDAPASNSRNANGPRNTQRRSPQKRQLDAEASSTREAKRPRTKAPPAAIIISSADEQPDSMEDEDDSSYMDDDRGMPVDSFEDACDVVSEPVKQQKPEKQLSSKGPRHLEQSAPAREPEQVKLVASQLAAEVLQCKETMRQPSYRPPARRSSRVDETGSPGATMGDFSLNGAPVKSNEKLPVVEPLEKPQRQPAPEFRINLSKPSPQRPMRVQPPSFEPILNPAPKQPSHVNERQALPKLTPQALRSEVPASLKPIPIIEPHQSSHGAEREALPRLSYRVGSHQDAKLEPAAVKEVARNVVREPVAAKVPLQASSKFMEGFKQALQPADQNRKIGREARQEQSENVQRTKNVGRQDGRHKELGAPSVPRDQYRQGRVPEICDSNLHVVVPAIIEIFLEKLRHKQGVVEKVATLYAGNGNKLINELKGSHREDQKVLAETYDRRRSDFIAKCERTMQGVQSIRDAMDGCGAGNAKSTDVRGAAIKQAMARLREAQAQRSSDGQAV